MENLGISPLDLIVLGILIFGALTGLVTGFVRGGLFLLSWAGAIIITIYGFSSITIYSRKYIENELLADIVGGAVVFLVSLLIRGDLCIIYDGNIITSPSLHSI